MDKNKLVLPISILLGCIILGGFFYASQIIKQRSIERQQRDELQAKMEADKTKADADQASETFSNNLKCQTLLRDLKQKWNNVTGIYYSEGQNTCVVKYTEKGETKEAAVESMQDTTAPKAPVTEKWTGETFLNGRLNDLGKIDSNNLPEFSNKQDCLGWGNNQKTINKTDSFKCGKNCGWVTTGDKDSYFICDEEVDI